MTNLCPKLGTFSLVISFFFFFFHPNSWIHSSVCRSTGSFMTTFFERLILDVPTWSVDTPSNTPDTEIWLSSVTTLVYWYPLPWPGARRLPGSDTTGYTSHLLPVCDQITRVSLHIDKSHLSLFYHSCDFKILPYLFRLWIFVIKRLNRDKKGMRYR